MRKGALLIIPLLQFCVTTISAQELKCVIEVNTSKLQNTHKALFENLEETMRGYMNSTRFSNVQIAPEEKIECRLLLTVDGYDNERVNGELLVQSTRPVYDSSYTTTLLNFRDQKVEFEFSEGDRIIFNREENTSSLAALLDFYAYMILGLDFDSFSLKGGNEFYDNAAAIVNRAQPSGDSGWKIFQDDRNRSALLNAFTDVSTSGIREMIYDYHRKGLDQMTVNPNKGRAVITDCLSILEEINSKKHQSIITNLIKDSKLDEIRNLYSAAKPDEKRKVASIFEQLYPTEQLFENHSTSEI